MSLRQFTDNNGRVWEVWETRPATTLSSSLRERIRSLHNAPTAASMMQGLEQGWLTFRAGAEKRRLSPVPEKWDDASDEQLARWWKKASIVPLGPGEEQRQPELGDPRSPI
jgi:hypothetical protein